MALVFTVFSSLTLHFYHYNYNYNLKELMQRIMLLFGILHFNSFLTGCILFSGNSVVNRTMIECYLSL